MEAIALDRQITEKNYCVSFSPKQVLNMNIYQSTDDYR